VADLPAPRLPRAALERVLLRAAELHTAASDVPEAMTEADLLALADEVGISSLAVKQALAEEMTRIALPEERGLMATLAGPARFSATRVVTGQAKEVLERIDRAFQRDENLMERRRFPDRIVWGARGGFAGAVRELVRLDGRGFPLARTDEVSATAIQVEPTRVHVRLETALVERRSSAMRSALAGIVSGSALSTVLLLVSVFAPLAIASGAVLATAVPMIARRRYRRSARAAQLSIEQALDRLEFGEARKRGLLDQILLSDR
jgi:hypothetical protein